MTAKNAAPGLKKTVKRRRSAALDRKKAKAGWFFILPFVIIFFLVYVPVLLTSINYSFNEIVRVSGGYDLDFVGWDNYTNALFVDPGFTENLVTGVQNLIFQVPAIVIFSLFMAVLLNQKMTGRTVFRAIFFVPVIISTGIMEKLNISNTLMSYLENSGGVDSGAEELGASSAAQIISAVDISALFQNMRVGTELVEYVVDLVNNIYDIINKAGVQMLIFLAGLQGISPAIYESCTVDGATAWETFWKITFPMISPMILVNAVYTIIDAFTSEGNTVMRYIDSVATGTATNANVVAQAMYWIYFLFVTLIIVLVAAICSAFVFYQRRD